MNRILLSSLVSAAVVLQPALAAAGLVQIGAAAGVKGRPMAVSEGQPAGHVIESGKPVYMNDHVTTDANSRMQVMLKDETVFTLGPSSDMILDEFVYDPATQNGKVTATVTKGVFRFVTGKIAGNQPSNMKVKLPVGTIGIRGTIVAGLVSGNMCAAMLAGPGAGNNANAKAGAFNLSNGAGSTEVKVSGEGSMITGGGAPTPAGPLPATVVGEINAGLAAKPASGSSDDGGGTGGSSEAKSGDGDGDSSASEQSGNSTAAGQESAGESAGTTEVAQALNDTATQGSQD
ncbi:MAG: FecR domain-containing protein, partial [Elusimicrobia bacterium]|nr:FecR domain-containing protein [Elusimicrobiota bacterium]